MTGSSWQRVLLVGLLVAVIVAVYVLGIVGAVGDDGEYGRPGESWVTGVRSALSAMPGLVDTLAAEDVAADPCVDTGPPPVLRGCTGLAIPDGIDQVVLRQLPTTCVVELRHPDEPDQSRDASDADDETGELVVPVAADGSTLTLRSLAPEPCVVRLGEG